MLHRFVFLLLRHTIAPLIKRIMRYSFDKQKGPDAPSILISNHNTNLDPALVAMCFSRHMYFLASEHAFRNGFKSKLLKFFFEPIPINKSRNDIFAIKEMLRRLKSGASVCLFAEGDRSFAGATGPVSLSTAKLVKTSGADLITFRLEGGYFTSPRWAKNTRRGKMTGKRVNRYAAEDLKAMTVRQVNSVIERDIFEDAYERQKANLIRYKGKNLAENIETVLYICAACGRLGTIRSRGDRFFCGCGLDAAYTETGFLDGEALPFTTIAEWDHWQFGKLAEIVDGSNGLPICADEGQTLFKVQPAAGSTHVGTGQMRISRDVFHCAGFDFPIEKIIRFAVAGQMTLLFSLKGGDSYEVHSGAPRSALKYKEVFRILTGKN